MATVKTHGVSMKFDAGDGTSFSKSLNGMSATGIPDAAKAKTFANAYAKIVAGTLKEITFNQSTPVAVD